VHTTTWVVMTVRIGSQNLWAWGKPSADGPGFDEIYYTHTDGFTPAEVPGDQPPSLGALLFVVTLPNNENRKRELLAHLDGSTVTVDVDEDDIDFGDVLNEETT